MENSSVILLVVAIAGGLFLLWIILYLIPVGLWFQALVSDVKISLLQLVLMRWRRDGGLYGSTTDTVISGLCKTKHSVL